MRENVIRASNEILTGVEEKCTIAILTITHMGSGAAVPRRCCRAPVEYGAPTHCPHGLWCRCSSEVLPRAGRVRRSNPLPTWALVPLFLGGATARRSSSALQPIAHMGSGAAVPRRCCRAPVEYGAPTHYPHGLWCRCWALVPLFLGGATAHRSSTVLQDITHMGSGAAVPRRCYRLAATWPVLEDLTDSPVLSGLVQWARHPLPMAATKPLPTGNLIQMGQLLREVHSDGI